MVMLFYYGAINLYKESVINIMPIISKKIYFGDTSFQFDVHKYGFVFHLIKIIEYAKIICFFLFCL